MESRRRSSDEIGRKWTSGMKTSPGPVSIAGQHERRADRASPGALLSPAQAQQLPQLPFVIWIDDCLPGSGKAPAALCVWHGSDAKAREKRRVISPALKLTRSAQDLSEKQHQNQCEMA